MKKLGMLFAVGLCVGAAQAADLKKCVDDKGRVYYGDSIPPDVLEKCRTSSELSKKGLETKTTRYPTSEERQAYAEEQARKKAEAQRAIDQRRRDTALLDTYGSEKEIDLARDRNLQSTQVQIDGTQLRIKSVQGRLDSLSKQAATIEKRGKPVPADLSTEIKAAEDEIKKLQTNVATYQGEAEAIKARFAEDKQRYRELRGIKTNVQ